MLICKTILRNDIQFVKEVAKMDVKGNLMVCNIITMRWFYCVKDGALTPSSPQSNRRCFDYRKKSKRKQDYAAYILLILVILRDKHAVIKGELQLGEIGGEPF